MAARASTARGAKAACHKEGIDPGQCPFDHDTNLASYRYMVIQE
jgi:hypothetical protein